ncbi:MAG: tRNA threonylcarbamoyladenosine biosynthesis protein TsaB [Nocardioidaceae bacterium]|jgi:tRNA threonylcarbamoyl adenosine modification protein YeaZ|nr:tRNA threonylcarbamoyladenosine biosynthesis protein TsaB [Nocardioidaceae bacterium]MDX6307781.1 tRNA threonylcarbamoyladenosine biosynthesis protein TsaB [Nocardioidaceae bacterium]
MLLALDTGTNAVTVAVHDGTATLAESTVEDRLRHGELLAPAIDRVLHDAGVDARALTGIAVGVGPGPYTGLRIGLATATAMGAALGIEVLGFCTLDVVAYAVQVTGPFLVATDARRKEVYWAAYSSPTQRSGDPAVDLPATVATLLPVAGNGPLLYPADFPNRVEPHLPRAADLARLVASGAARAMPTVPLYLRRPDVAVPTAAKRVT